MKKHLFRLLCIVLVLSLTFSLFSCEKQDRGETDASSSQKDTEEKATTGEDQASNETEPPVDNPPEPTMTRAEAEAIIAALSRGETETAELWRAYEMGLPIADLAKGEITAREYAAFLDVLVNTYAPERIGDWKKLYPEFRGADTVITRYDALAALYLAANFLGEEFISTENSVLYCGGESSSYESDPFGAAEFLAFDWEKEQPNWELFGGDEVRGVMFDHPVVFIESGALNDVAYRFNFARPSKFSDEYPFAVDEERNSIRAMDNCTYLEAILAVLRYKDSLISRKEALSYIFEDMTYYDINDTEALAPYYAEMEKRKNGILNSETTIVKSDTFIRGETYTGTAYYVSNNGNDDNDGLTPETAWKSPNRYDFGDIDLQPGDAIFYERGSTFRLVNSWLTLRDDITYSAYGEGEKPVFTISAENSANPEYWSLYYEGNDGEKIWQYSKLLGDVGGVVLDDEYMCMRVLEWPTPDGYLALTFDGNNAFGGESYYGPKTGMVNTGKYLSAEENLTENLTFISRFDVTDLEYPLDVVTVEDAVLYLRCDEGNPGELYDSIEIIAGTYNNAGLPLSAYEANGFVLDNLAIKYYLSSAVGGNLNSCRSAVMQNCVVAFGGSRLHKLYSAEPTQEESTIGDGVYVFVNNVTFRNNYLYRTNTGFTTETVGDPPEPMDLGTLKIVGNVFEDCDTPIQITYGEGCAPEAFDEIIIQDNYMAGTAKYRQQPIIFYDAYAIHINYQNIRFFKHCDISENIILGSERLIFATQSKWFPFDIHDNVVAQDKDGLFWLEYRMDSIEPGVVRGNLWYPYEGLSK